ncbi:MAG: CoA transferase [Candidatus Rokubacteria bacterium]|nr:CoA transferase [Candidatus Rokubacteria bacterium]
MTQALDGIRVVDFSWQAAGPFCTMLLADNGAEVIKVENPESGGDPIRRLGPPFAGGESAYFLCLNRNKKSVTLNLKHPRGSAIARELCRSADVVIENFKVGTMERLGLGFDALAEANPRLVYCSITGYGRTGPLRDRPAFDVVMQGFGGLMSFTGEPDGQPMRVGLAIIDYTAGMFAALGITMALMARSLTGRGQRVDTSLLETTLGWLNIIAANYLIGGEVARRHGVGHPNAVPYQTFRTKDTPLIIGILQDDHWQRFCRVLGAEHLASDPRFATNADRVEHRGVLIPLLQDILLGRTAAEWLAALQAAEIVAGPIHTIDQVFSHPQVRAREMVLEVEHPTAGAIKLVGFPLKFSGTPSRIGAPPPLLGQHTEAVLGDLGYSAAEVAALRAEGAV